MTLRIIVLGADFSANPIGRYLKLTTDRTDLVGEYIFGGYASASIYNGANPAVPLTVNGSPTYGSGSVGCGQTKWFDTSLLDAQELTFMFIADAVPTNVTYMGNYNGSNSSNSQVLFKQAGNFTLNTSANDNTTQTITSAVSLTGADATYRAVAVRTTGSADYITKIDQFKAGVRAGGTSTTHTGKTREVQPTPAFAIGSGRGTATLTGDSNIAGALMWHRHLSDAELLAAYLEARTTLAMRGITC